MKRPALPPDAPESWRLSAHYDAMEVFGEAPRSPYAMAYARRREETLAAVRRYARPGGRILDVAAAQGNFSLALAEAGFEVTWNDLRAELADYVERKRTHGVIHYRPGNVLELAEAPHDLVLATEVIEHVAHPDRFLAQLARFVRPGGHIVLTTPNGGYFRNRLPRFSDHPDPSVFESAQFKPDGDGHIFLLHEDEVGTLSARAGLEVVELRSFTWPLSAGRLGTAPVLKVAPMPVLRAAEALSARLPGPIRRRLHLHLLAVLRRPAT